MAFSPELITFLLLILVVYLMAFLYVVVGCITKKEQPRLIVKKWTEILAKDPFIVLINWEQTRERRSPLVTRYTKSATLVVYAEGHRFTYTRQQAKFYRFEL